MSSVTKISRYFCSSMEVSREEAVIVTRNSDSLEIQSEGINLCFVEKHGTETEDESFISDTLSSDDTMHMFGKQSSSEHQLYVPLIQEIESHGVADSCNDLIVCNNDHSSVETALPHLVNTDSCGNFVKEEEASDSSLLCKSFASLPMLLQFSVCVSSC